MNIREIAYRLNDIADVAKSPFSKLQEVRRAHGLSPRAKNPFAAFSIKDNYAFHAGGRKELQFNIGLDFINGTHVVRYGVAFSLNEDRTLHNSKAEFRPAIERFNNFLKNDNDFFEGFNMWYYTRNKFNEYFKVVREIDESLFQTENFIFIGKYFIKEIKDIIDEDLKEVLATFNYLMQLYELVQFGVIKNENRIARLCWNYNGWIMPSGSQGKSSNKDTHEATYKYGHEEWLFDISKLIGGFHYGFLEPIRKQQAAYENKSYDTWLYTIDSVTKKRYWIGEVKNVEVLNDEDAEATRIEYIKRGWFKEMEDQIIACGANPKGFSEWNGVNLFNVRYLPSNLKLNDQYFELPRHHPIYEQSRYSFAHFKDEFNVEAKDERAHFSFRLDENMDDEDDETPSIKTYVREPKLVEIKYLHKAISKALTKELKIIYGNANVQDEHPAGYGSNKIDIVVQDDSELIFYEIKSYTSLRVSIREAIGQLMEYSLWTNKQKAKQLIIVTQPLEEIDNARIYFKHIRDTYKLPLYYQSYDHVNNILSELV